MVHLIQLVRIFFIESLFTNSIGCVNIQHFYVFFGGITDENVIGLSLQEILPDNNNVKAEKMLVANPPNILKRAKSMRMENSVSLSFKSNIPNIEVMFFALLSFFVLFYFNLLLKPIEMTFGLFCFVIILNE